MRILFSSPGIAVLVIFVSLSISKLANAETVAIVNVSVIPMTSEQVLTAQTVISTGGRIVTIGPVEDVRIPEDIVVVDGTDRFLMPGLSEMHGHVPGSDTYGLQRVLDLYVANGITLMRGMLGEPAHLELRDKLLAHEVRGPQLLTSGPSFNGRSVSSPAQAASMVEEQHAAGYDFLKIHPGLTLAEFNAVAAKANELKIPFAGHVPADVGVVRALASGIATIDHLDGYMQTLVRPNDDPSGGFEGFFGLLLAGHADESKIAAIVEATRNAGTWNVPTESLIEHVVSTVDADEMKDWPEMRYMPTETVSRWVNYKKEIQRETGYSEEIANRAIELRRELIRQLHASGAGLLLGSDSPQIFNVPGFAIHRELQLLVDAGLSPYQALRTGTVSPAVFFGKADDWGTVEVGKVANLVLLDDNPLVDISASRRVHGVLLRGRWVGRPEIKSMLAALKR